MLEDKEAGGNEASVFSSSRTLLKQTVTIESEIEFILKWIQ